MKLPGFLQDVFNSKSDRSNQHSPKRFMQLWEAKFGQLPPIELVENIGDYGTSWKMDRKGNFKITMENGSTYFVGDKVVESTGSEATVVERNGGLLGFMRSEEDKIQDAKDMMLMHAGMGKKSVRFEIGSRKDKAMMYAAAMIAGLQVRDYKPDRLALEYKMRFEREKEERDARRKKERAKNDNNGMAPGVTKGGGSGPGVLKGGGS